MKAPQTIRQDPMVCRVIRHLSGGNGAAGHRAMNPPGHAGQDREADCVGRPADEVEQWWGPFLTI